MVPHPPTRCIPPPTHRRHSTRAKEHTAVLVCRMFFCPSELLFPSLSLCSFSRSLPLSFSLVPARTSCSVQLFPPQASLKPRSTSTHFTPQLSFNVGERS